MTFKKWLSALLAVIMVCAMVPVAQMEEVEASYEEVAADYVEELPEEYAVALDEEEPEEVTFDLPVPEDAAPVAEELPEETLYAEEVYAEPEAPVAIVKGIPVLSADDGTFVVDNGELVEYKGDATDVVIPDVVSGKDEEGNVVEATVLYIATEAFQGNEKITSVSIPTHVKQIYGGAFSGCTKLETVTFASDSWMENELGPNAFEGCESLKTIALPEAVTTINEFTFAGCKALTDFDFSNIKEIEESAFEGCVGLTKLDLSKVNSFASNAFDGCTGLTEITVNGERNSYLEGVENLTKVIVAEGSEYIAEGFIAYMSSVTEVVIPDSVETIEDYAFAGTGLKDLPAMNGVKSINYGAFADLKNLKEEITIPENIENAYYPFENCTTLKKIIVNSGENARYSSWGLKSGLDPAPEVELAKTAKAIPGSFYSGDEDLTKIDATILTPNIVSIGDNAFVGCDNVTSIDIPANIATIGFGAFYGLSNVTSVKIAEGVTSIEGYAFAECNNQKLVSIEIPQGVETIGDYAFMDCNIQEFTIPDSVTYFGANVFEGCDYLKTITLKTGDIDNYNRTVYDYDNYERYYSVSYRNITNGTHLDKFAFADGSKCIPNGFFEGQSLKNRDISIPSSVTVIGERAFANTDIAEITIPDGVQEIREGAFAGCENLTSITVPGSVEEIGFEAFTDCTALKEVTIADGAKKIDGMVFSGCNALETINIADSVESIGWDAFNACEALTSVKLPASLDCSDEDSSKNILFNLFNGCEKLATVDLSACTKLNGIGSYSLNNLPALAEVKLPESVTTIEEGAFKDDAKLATINLDNVTKIEKQAFKGCAALTEVTLPNKDVTIGTAAFDSTTTLKCYVGTANVEAYAKKNGNKLVYLDPINALTISFKDDKTSYEITGAAIEPEMVVKNGETVLTKDTDYSVTYANNVNAGTATVTVTGLNDYKGVDEASSKRELTFEITSSVGTLTATIANPEAGTDSFYYTGAAIEPEVVVKVGETALVKGTDYTLTYADNINQGTGKITVNVTKTGYVGTVNVNFTILQKVIILSKARQTATEAKGFNVTLGLTDGLTIVKCRSSRKSVAEVTDDGIVTTKAAGKTTITVTMSNKKTRRLVLTVVDPTLVTKITMNQTGTQSLTVGNTLQLGVTMEPAATYKSDVIWKSSNNRVATVDENGVVTALKKGNVTITATPTNPAKRTLKVKIKIKVTP